MHSLIINSSLYSFIKGIVPNVLAIVILLRINRKNPMIRIVMILIAISDSIEILNYVLEDCFQYIFFDFHHDAFQIFRHANLYW